MNIATVILIAFNTLGLGANLAMHGEPRKGNYNFWYALIGFSIEMLLIWLALTT